jgi:hypothetical protein
MIVGSLKCRIIVQANLGKKQDPISKIIIIKWTRGVVQTVECLPSKQKILSSNPSTVKNKKEKNVISGMF